MVTDIDKLIVHGENISAAVAFTLVSDSVWFMVEPLPNNHWEFTVKKEAIHILVATSKETLKALRTDTWECLECDDSKAEVTPEFYQDSGIPMCISCDQEMVYKYPDWSEHGS